MKKWLTKGICVLAFAVAAASCSENKTQKVDNDNDISVNTELGCVMQRADAGSTDTYYVADFRAEKLTKTVVVLPNNSGATTIAASETNFSDITDASDLAKLAQMRKHMPQGATASSDKDSKITVNADIGCVMQKVGPDTYYVADFRAEKLTKTIILMPGNNAATSITASTTSFSDIKDASDMAKVKQLRQHMPAGTVNKVTATASAMKIK